MEDNIEDWQSRNDNKFSSIASRISSLQIALLAAAALLIIYLTTNSIDNKQFTYWAYGIFITVIIILLFKKGNSKRIIPMELAKKIAQKSMDRMKRESSEIPSDSVLYDQPACHLKYENDMITGTSGPIAWEVGVKERVHGTQYIKDWVVSIHCYDGIVTGMRYLPLGYTGNESKDVTIIPVGIIPGNTKTTDFGNPNLTK